ncbi:MAG TPA: hypothetical protein VHL53_08715, partial [Acidimicrobiia bacterium]|nr:hypothetical protein [Acidimicrobiia bacterium]
MRSSLRRLAMGAAATVAAAGALAMPGSVPMAAAGSFEGGSATARAEAVRVQVDSVGAPGTDRPVDFAFPSSAASVSSLQGSAGQASLAYPGEIVLNGPGLCKVFVPQCEAPDYPFFVETHYGTKNDAKVQYGLTVLEAASREHTSKGSAVTAQGDPASAGGQNASTSTGTIDPDTGIASAEAATVTDAISFGDTLKIGSVHATASVTQEPGKDLVRRATLEVKGLTIAGQSVGITSEGLVAGDKPTPLPAGNPFEQALSQAGIKLRWLGGYNTANGIVAPQLEITAQGQMPGLPAPSILTVRLGYATAAVEAGRSTSNPFGIKFPAGGQASAGPPAEPEAPATASEDIAPPPPPTPEPSAAPGPDVSISGQPLDFSPRRPAP